MNFTVSVLNWVIKIKSKETGYTINYWMNYTYERGKPNRGCHKIGLKCFYSFYFSVKNGRWDTITEECIFTHIICWLLLVLIWAKAVKSKWRKCKEDSKICNGSTYIDNKTRSFTLWNMFVCIYLQFICMYLFAIDKKSLKIVHCLILQSMKLSN